MCQSELPDKAFSRAIALAFPVVGVSELGGGVEGGVIGGTVFVGTVLGGGGVGIVSGVLVGGVELGAVEDEELELSPPHPKRSSRNAHKEKKTQVNLPARMRFATNNFESPVVTVFGRGYSLEDSSVHSSHRLGGSLALVGNLPE